MVQAFELQGGIKDNMVTHCDVSNFEEINMTSGDIPAIKSFFHFNFEKGSDVRVSKYYNIGTGKLITLNKQDIRNMFSGDFLVNTTIDWKESQKESRPQKESKTTNKRILNEEYNWSQIPTDLLTTETEEKISFDKNKFKKLYVKNLSNPYAKKPPKQDTPLYDTTNDNRKIIVEMKFRWESSAMGHGMSAKKHWQK